MASPWSYTCSHSLTECWVFGFLQESSLGSRAKTAALSLLHQAGVKSTNRLLWPNVIKPQPGSGTVRVPVLSVPCELHILRAAAQHPSLQWKRFHCYQLGVGWILWNNPSVTKPASLISTAGGSVEAMSEDGAPHSLSQCGVPPAALHGRRTTCVSDHICAHDCWASHKQLDI